MINTNQILQKVRWHNKAKENAKPYIDALQEIGVFAEVKFKKRSKVFLTVLDWNRMSEWQKDEPQSEDFAKFQVSAKTLDFSKAFSIALDWLVQIKEITEDKRDELARRNQEDEN
jgi:hypothetical protein